MIPNINISDYDYPLPETSIPFYPPTERQGAKLLRFVNGKITDHTIPDIPNLLAAQGLVVFNNSKVINARLFFRNKTGARIEIFCLEPDYPQGYSESLQTTRESVWFCMVGNLRKWRNREPLEININAEGKEIVLTATFLTEVEGIIKVQFRWNNTTITFGDLLTYGGNIPLPPYLNRGSEDTDKIRYQTAFAKPLGSVAAPTAGLHFTEDVLEQLKRQSTLDYITLHVGAGTFKPVTSPNIAQHSMHREFFTISIETLKNIIQHLGNITAVGTTSVRTLESLYWIGLKLYTGDLNLSVGQWDIYEHLNSYTLSAKKALQTLLEYMERKGLAKLETYTSIIIVPGYKFRIITRMITNFHQPKSTLLLLISAFVGEDWRVIYQYALKNDYRFLSYGDTSLLE